MSNLDEASFEQELVAAAEHACKGENEEARQRLQAAFDLLHTAREYFYPVEAHLLDLTLLAPTTLGPSLRTDLAGRLPVNFLVSGEVIEEMARREPQSLEALRTVLAEDRAAILGGEHRELELPLLSPEAIGHQLKKGLDAYQRHLGVRPTVFGRRRFGLTPVLPQILDKLDFVGAMHSTLDDGRFPASDQSRVRWEGVDGTVIESLARVPSDISRADAFLRLPQQLGNSMDMDHVATVLFAHWPGRSSTWYEDVRRVTRYTRVMGSFATVSDYFQQTGMSGRQAAYKADEYRSPYLVQAVAAGQSDPISRWVRYYRRRAAAEAVQALRTLARLVAGGQAVEHDDILAAVDDSLGTALENASLSLRERAGVRRIDEETATCSADSGSKGPHPNPLPEGEGTCGHMVPVVQLDQQIEKELTQAIEAFSHSTSGSVQPSGQGFLVANPLSFPRRVCLEMPELRTLPDVADPIQFAAESAGRKTVVVDVPPMGFAWIGPGSGEALAPKAEPRKWGFFRKRPATEPVLAELLEPDRGRPARRAENEPSTGGMSTPQGVLLRNESFEVALDPRTGAIRGIFDYRTRGPRLGQQIAMRLPQASGDGDDAYSIMAADEILITSTGPVLGEAVVRGRLLAWGKRHLAGFRQSTRVWRGSRVIEVEIELDIAEPPGPEPWASYYTARFAWPDEAANLYRSVNMASLPTEAPQFEAPHFIDVRLDKTRTTLLTAGLPYHRRVGLRRLDSLLVVRGETARTFRFGIGIDLPEPMTAALDFLAPRTICAGAARPPHSSGWLFHLDARNVVATHWEPLVDAGRIDGYRVRLLETDGRSVSLGLRSFRTVQSARKVGSANRPEANLSIEGDRITLELGGHEWAEVEARFAG
jgi:alpha-mannosidase